MHNPFRPFLRLFWTCLALGLACSPLPAASEPVRPNIVFLLADDLGWRDVGFHGGNIPTPHLDRLAKGSLELTQHYVYSMCSASRACLLTGRYSTRFGFAGARNERALPWNTITLPLALRMAGYATALSGKWHLGSMPEWGPQHFGFDHSYGSFAGGVGPWDHQYKKGRYSRTWQRNGSYVEEEGHVTDLLTREGVHWIESRRRSQPFLLYMAFTAPHVPIREPDEFVRRVPAEITEPSRREYAAAVMHLDDGIGRLLDALRRTGHWENTIVVFTSDNGAVPNNPNYPPGTSGYLPDNYAQGPAGGDNRPLRGQKGTIYEGGIRTPTLVSWPGRLPPGKLTAPVHMVDWMPTFCALAAYRPEKNLQWDGKDVWPLLSGSGQIEPRPLYWSSPGLDVRAVRLGDWKLMVRYPQRILGPLPPRGASAELFNLAADPNETTDLAPRKPGKVNELLAVLAEVARSDGDALAND